MNQPTEQIGNKSSEYTQELVNPRDDGSYVYEKFMDGQCYLDCQASRLG